jgi:hypothetical protein
MRYFSFNSAVKKWQPATLVEASNVELGYVAGVLSPIQPQLNSKAPANLTIVAAKTGNYQIASGDENDLIQLNGTFTVTVPADGTLGYTFAIGTQINLLNIGTGVITVAGSGATVNGTPGLKLRAQSSSAMLVKRAANVWVLVGDLTV